jgi:hypothetical protein
VLVMLLWLLWQVHLCRQCCCGCSVEYICAGNATVAAVGDTSVLAMLLWMRLQCGEHMGREYCCGCSVEHICAGNAAVAAVGGTSVPATLLWLQ